MVSQPTSLTYLRRASRKEPSFCFTPADPAANWMCLAKLALTIALFVSFGAASAILAQDDSNLVVLKCGWQKERIRPRASSVGYASQDELVLQSQRQQQLAAARNSRNVGQEVRLETQITNHEKAKVEATQTDLPRDGYRYKVTLRNDGTKSTISIDWDYLFIDPATQQVIGRHQFTSDESIKPRKNKEISVLYLSTPIKTINAKTLSEKRASLIEQVVIMRVQFSDGTVWQRH